MSQIVECGPYRAVIENQSSLMVQRRDGARMEPEEFIRVVKHLLAEDLLPVNFGLSVQPLEEQ
jgi:hypothetical protein